ncbi:MAG: histidinol dehydrogenase [Prevotella sp.]|nr:histidinol dehydrogenase [Prevotella sp.]
MKTYKNPPREQWSEIVKRPHLDSSKLYATVRGILDDVRSSGDTAILKYEEQFDHVTLCDVAVAQEEINSAREQLPEGLYAALEQAHHNIYVFHEAQRLESRKIETQPGVTCWQKSIPIEKVGLYIPGGTAPLFSTVLMLATPAKIAGCREIVLCTPPGRDGRVNPAILAAAEIAGVSKIFKTGGVQAIGGMAYGTQSIPKVYKIFGPGNQYVMAAKQLVAIDEVAIDMPAGPSEVCVIADESSEPEFVAADLLSQAEHGTDSQVIMITTSEIMIDKVRTEIDRQLQVLPRKEIAEKALENSKMVLVRDNSEAMALSNMYAPEHLILSTDDYEKLAEKVVNAGSVFLGKYACESAGDYASGTNHTLPTHGHAVAYNGVNLDSFFRKTTFQYITEEGIRNIGKTVEVMAENEMLSAHAHAMRIRKLKVKS